MNDLKIDFTCNIPEITEAVQYVINDGKKIRANIIYSMGNQSEISIIFAHVIEFLHNASLILDDLPCMDNSDIRRNKPTLHKYKGESIAQLSVMILVTQAQYYFYKGIYLLEKKLKIDEFKEIRKFLEKEYLDAISENGLSGGQYHDLTVKNYITTLPPRKQQETILNILKLKTGSLFSLAFIFGYISKNNLDDYHCDIISDMKTIGLAVGMCYQIIDDICDIEEDSYSNLCKYFNRNAIIDIFTNFISIFYNGIYRYKINEKYIIDLYTYLMENIRIKIEKL